MNLSNKLVGREERVIKDLRLRRSGEDSVRIMTIKRVISLVITYEINRMIWSSSENSYTRRIPQSFLQFLKQRTAKIEIKSVLVSSISNNSRIISSLIVKQLLTE
jgi:hypothetical protein